MTTKGLTYARASTKLGDVSAKVASAWAAGMARRRAAKMTPLQRSEQARKAALARWGKRRGEPEWSGSAAQADTHSSDVEPGRVDPWEER